MKIYLADIFQLFVESAPSALHFVIYVYIYIYIYFVIHLDNSKLMAGSILIFMLLELNVLSIPPSEIYLLLRPISKKYSHKTFIPIFYYQFFSKLSKCVAVPDMV